MPNLEQRSLEESKSSGYRQGELPVSTGSESVEITVTLTELHKDGSQIA